MIAAPVLSRSDRLETLDRLLVRLLDLGILSLIFLAPLFMGGRHPVGRLVYVTCACWLAVIWSLRQCIATRPSWNWTGVEWLLLAGLFVPVMQLVPLSPDLLHRLSPALGDLLPLWSNTDSSHALGAWNQLSLVPAETRGGLVMYLAYAMIFLAVSQRLRTIEDVDWVLRCIAIAAIGMAVLGLAQFLFGNGKFLWLYEHPSRTTYGVTKGPFANQNHFAHFLALGVGPVIWWIQRGNSRVQTGDRSHSAARSHRSEFSNRSSSRSSHACRRQTHKPTAITHALCVGLGIVLFAALLTFSRGGVAAIGLAVVVCIGAYVRAGLFGRRALIAMAAFGMVVAAALSIYGYEPLARRIETLATAQSVEDACRGRHALWKADCAAVRQFPVFGTGVGSHRETYPIFMTEYFETEFTHAESGYLHLLVETGFAGLACLLLGVSIALTWGLRAFTHPSKSGTGVPQIAAQGAVCAGIFVSAAHSVADFVWYIPACMTIAVILAACACRMRSNLANQPATELRPADATLATSESRARWQTGKTERQSAADSREVPAPRHFPQHANPRPLADNPAFREPRPVWRISDHLLPGFAAFVSLAISLVMVQNRLPSALGSAPWDSYQRVTRQARTEIQDDAAKTDQTVKEADYLKQTVLANPDDARAHQRIATALLRRFELQQKTATNPMELPQIRDAAIASRFPTFEALDRWLDIAVGDNRKLLDAALAHCKRAVSLCPLQGEAYVYLAELSFLDPSRKIAKGDYIRQAGRVRPNDGSVMFAVGSEAALAGDLQTTLQCWKTAFHRNPEAQGMIIQAAAPNLPAEDFLAFFRPDVAGLGRLYYFYRNTDRQREAHVAGRHYAESLRMSAQREADRRAAASQLQESQAVYDFLNQLPDAINCQQDAANLEPDNYQIRLTLAQLLLRSGQFTDAEEQIKWCQRRHPDDPQVQHLLAQAKRDRIARIPTANLDSARLQ